MVFSPSRRRTDRRPPHCALRKSSTSPGRLLHPHTHRCNHLATQQRCRWRTECADKHIGFSREQRHRACHHPGHDGSPRVASHPAVTHRAPNIHHPGTPRGSSSARYFSPSNATQRHDEHPDDRTIQRCRRHVGEVVRRRTARTQHIQHTSQRSSRCGYLIGNVGTGLLRRTRPRRRNWNCGHLRHRRLDGGERFDHRRHTRCTCSVSDEGLPTAHRAHERTCRSDDVDGVV